MPVLESAGRGQSAVDRDDLGGDEAGTVADEEDQQRRQA
jgi:hypothetical protein